MMTLLYLNRSGTKLFVKHMSYIPLYELYSLDPDIVLDIIFLGEWFKSELRKKDVNYKPVHKCMTYH